MYVGGHDPSVVSNMRQGLSRMPKLGGWKWQNISSPIIENSAAGAYVEYAIRGVGPAHPEFKTFKPLQPLPGFLHFLSIRYGRVMHVVASEKQSFGPRHSTILHCKVLL